ncbi:hypothetical protein COO60DRAFT_1042058 [Scenedesmus sp. NREL 46B-D3]|nr:hypothetical protein COO60DRAFT_1042058 [Scenedesmus sp. NREL 46B-D3]
MPPVACLGGCSLLILPSIGDTHHALPPSCTCRQTTLFNPSGRVSDYCISVRASNWCGFRVRPAAKPAGWGAATWGPVMRESARARGTAQKHGQVRSSQPADLGAFKVELSR